MSTTVQPAGPPGQLGLPLTLQAQRTGQHNAGPAVSSENGPSETSTFCPWTLQCRLLAKSMKALWRTWSRGRRPGLAARRALRWREIPGPWGRGRPCVNGAETGAQDAGGHQELGKWGNRSPEILLREGGPPHTVVWIPSLQDCERRCCFRPPVCGHCHSSPRTLRRHLNFWMGERTHQRAVLRTPGGSAPGPLPWPCLVPECSSGPACPWVLVQKSSPSSTPFKVSPPPHTCRPCSISLCRARPAPHRAVCSPWSLTAAHRAQPLA